MRVRLQFKGIEPLYDVLKNGDRMPYFPCLQKYEREVDRWESFRKSVCGSSLE